MENNLIIFLVVLAILGVILVGGGLTGKVVSESCCFLPNCQPENVCNSVPSSHTAIYVGGMLLGAAISLYIVLHKGSIVSKSKKSSRKYLSQP